MGKKYLKFWEATLVFVGIIFFLSTKVWAVGTLIPISSATYNGPANNTDRGSGVAVD
jgi:hypothetical protein